MRNFILMVLAVVVGNLVLRLILFVMVLIHTDTWVILFLASLVAGGIVLLYYLLRPMIRRGGGS